MTEHMISLPDGPCVIVVEQTESSPELHAAVSRWIAGTGRDDVLVAFIQPGTTVAVLDESDMHDHGWIRRA